MLSTGLSTGSVEELLISGRFRHVLSI